MSRTIWDGFHPMEEDFKSLRVNSYDSGPGSRMPTVRQPGYNNGIHNGNSDKSPDNHEIDTLKLYVSRVPKDMEESGFINYLRSRGCPQPISVKLLQSAKEDANKLGFKFAFLDFESTRDASRALSILSRRLNIQGQPQFNFKVSFARKVGDRELRERIIEEQFQQFLKSKTRSVKSEDDCNEMKDTPLPLNKNRSQPVMNELSRMKKLFMPLASQNENCPVCFSDDYYEHLHLFTDDNTVENPDELIPSLKEITCAFCDKAVSTGFQVCSSCSSAFYCCATCQRRHWKQHAPKCMPVGVGLVNGAASIDEPRVSKPLENGAKTTDVTDNASLNIISKKPEQITKIEEKEIVSQVSKKHKTAASALVDSIPSTARLPEVVQKPEPSRQASTAPIEKEISKAPEVFDKVPASKGDLEKFGEGDVRTTRPQLKVTPKPRKEIGQQFLDVNGENLLVAVTYGTSPENFFVQRLDDEEKAAFITACLTTECSKMKDWPEVKSFTVNQYCAAIYEEDSLWYRAKLLHKSGDKYDIKFIDYGNVENVKETTLRPLPEQLYDTPALGIKCKLHNVKPVNGDTWSTEAIARFGELTESGLYVFCKVFSQDVDKTFSIDLLDGEGRSITDALIKSDQAIRASSTPKVTVGDRVKKTSPTPKESPKLHPVQSSGLRPPRLDTAVPEAEPPKPAKIASPVVDNSSAHKEVPTVKPAAEVTKPVKPLKNSSSMRQLLMSKKESELPKAIPSLVDMLKEGDTYQAILTSAHDPSTFRYCVMLDPEAYVDLASDLANDFEDPPLSAKVNEPKVGTLVAAKGNDDEWYRSFVMRINKDGTILCLFIDTGYVEAVNAVYTLPATYFNKKALFAFAKVFGGFSQSALTNLELDDDPCRLTVLVSTTKDDEAITRVKFDEFEISCNMSMKSYLNAYQEMLHKIEEEEQKAAKPVDPYAMFQNVGLVGPETTAIIMYVPEEDQTEFFVLGSAEQAQKLMELMEVQVENAPTVEPKVGLPCLAYCEGDGEWYRAVITDLTEGGKCKVYYMDFGNCDEVPADKIKKLPDSLSVDQYAMMAVKCKLAETEHSDIQAVVRASEEQNGLKIKILSDEGNYYTVSVRK